MMPVVYPVYMSGLAANAEAVANGGQAINIAAKKPVTPFRRWVGSEQHWLYL